MSNPLKMGPGTLTYQLNGSDTAVIISKIREEDECIFSVVEKKAGVRYHAFVGDQDGTTIIESATLACSLDLDLDLLPELKSNYKKGTTGVGMDPIGVPLDFGVLRFHPKNRGAATDHDLVGKKVSAILNPSSNYAKDGMVKVAAVFDFSSNDNEGDPDFGMPYTWGDYT